MVDKVPAMVSMELDSEEQAEMINPSPPRYPWGLSICLCQDELDKLNIDTSEISVGDLLHMHSLAKVTSVSSTDTEDSGPRCSVQLQIVAIAAESEDEENNQAESKMSKFYL